ncbi:MAG TPA: class I SAM-dependent methyltransferase, partial [Candidatus Limnocylindrales bacterium]
GTPPWVGGAREELVRLVESGILAPPGRVIDLGCGEGDNAIFLAQQGFDVTAVDFAPAAIEKARAKAAAAGIDVEFVVDDFTRLARVKGEFDLLVDYGAFDDLRAAQRAAYVREIVPLARPGGRFLLWCFEWEPLLWERIAMAILPGNLTLRPGEIGRAFGAAFDIERVAGESGLKSWPRGWAAYLMTRK